MLCNRFNVAQHRYITTFLNIRIMEELDYWKKRCLLAEDYINREPCRDFLEEIKSDIIPPKSKYTK